MISTTSPEQPPRAAHRLTDLPAMTGIPLRIWRAEVRAGRLPVIEATPRVRVVLAEDLDRWLRDRRQGVPA